MLWIVADCERDAFWASNRLDAENKFARSGGDPMTPEQDPLLGLATVGAAHGVAPLWPHQAKTTFD